MAKVILICGRICCGKTTYAHRLRMERRAVVLSCDEVMLALLDEQLGDRHEVYAARTEAYLLQKSLEIIETGIDVILDWGPWTRDGRSRVRAFYASHDVECELHGIRVSEEEWKARIAKRNAQIDDGVYQAYHVDEGLERKFLSRYEEPASDEISVWVEE